MLAAILGAPLLAVFIAAVISPGAQPPPRIWRLVNTVFTLGAIAWGSLTCCFFLLSNATWDSLAPNEWWAGLSILIGPLLALAGIALAWRGLARGRFGLTLAGPILTSVGPMAAYAAFYLAGSLGAYR